MERRCGAVWWRGLSGGGLQIGLLCCVVVSGIGGVGCSRGGDGGGGALGQGAVVFLGDSLTARHELSGDTRLYPEILGKKWGREVVNLSMSGMRADQALARFGKEIDRLDTGGVAACILVLGANDQLAGRTGGEFKSDLGDISRKLQGRGWRVFVVRAMVPLRGGGGDYEDAYQAVASEAGTPLSDDIVSAYLRQPGGTGGDGIHPSAEGHAMIAEALDQDFGGILGEGK